ncbi:MAG: hypothetical protein ACTSUE_17525 [Promethearchaeota archaeon]
MTAVPYRPFYLHDDPGILCSLVPFFTHEYLVYFSSLPQYVMDLEPVKVQANPGFDDWEVGPGHEDLYVENSKKVRDLPPAESFNCSRRNGDFTSNVPLASLEPWKILVYYTSEPDLNLDCDLNLHWTQKLTKGSHALRHMQFRLFGLRIGRLIDTYRYHVDASLRSFKIGNAYWGWRFLARACHYLADMGHPFHSKVAPLKDVIGIFFHPRSTFKLLSALHNGHEVFTQSNFRTGDESFKNALIRGSERSLESKVSLDHEIKKYRKRAIKQLGPIVRALKTYFGSDFINIYNLVNRKSDVDVSKRTDKAEWAAQNYLFSNLSNPGLQVLEDITCNLLEDVGFMTGLLLGKIKEEVNQARMLL